MTVAFATDGTWVVAIPAGALSGLADVAMYGSPAGLFQCVLGPAAGTVGARPDLGPLTPTCAALPSLTAATDPRVQHIFTDWIDPLVDRATALSVAATAALPDAPGPLLLGGVEFRRAGSTAGSGRVLLLRRGSADGGEGRVRFAGARGSGRPGSTERHHARATGRPCSGSGDRARAATTTRSLTQRLTSRETVISTSTDLTYRPVILPMHP